MIADLEVYDPTLPLATLDEETGGPPETRASSVAVARQRINEISQAEIDRSQRRSKIKRLLDGNPQVPHSEMVRLNRRGDANVNWRTSEGTVDAAKTPYYDLTVEDERFYMIET